MRSICVKRSFIVLCQEVLHRLQIRFCYGVIPAWIINPLILLRIGNSFSSSVMQLLPMMRHSGLRSQRFYPLRVFANRRQPPERAGPLPRRQEGPGWGYPQPGRKFLTFMESGVGNIPVLIAGHIQSDWHSLAASALCGTASRHQPFSSPPFSKTSCTPFETTA